MQAKIPECRDLPVGGVGASRSSVLEDMCVS